MPPPLSRHMLHDQRMCIQWASAAVQWLHIIFYSVDIGYVILRHLGIERKDTQDNVQDQKSIVVGGGGIQDLVIGIFFYKLCIVFKKANLHLEHVITLLITPEVSWFIISGRDAAPDSYVLVVFVEVSRNAIACSYFFFFNSGGSIFVGSVSLHKKNLSVIFASFSSLLPSRGCNWVWETKLFHWWGCRLCYCLCNCSN